MRFPRSAYYLLWRILSALVTFSAAIAPDIVSSISSDCVNESDNSANRSFCCHLVRVLAVPAVIPGMNAIAIAFHDARNTDLRHSIRSCLKLYHG